MAHSREKHMSDHHQFIYPRYPHLPAPDWQDIHVRLIEQGFLLPATGDQVPHEALLDLAFRLVKSTGCQFLYDEHWNTPADVLAGYATAGILPAGLPLNPLLSVREVLALLGERHINAGLGYDLDMNDECKWSSPIHCLGPAAVACLSPVIRRVFDETPRDFNLCLFVLRQFTIPVGENFREPSLPGTEEPLEDIPPFGSPMKFIELAYEDPAIEWVNPKDNHAHHILDLDWHFGFGMGTHMIRTQGLDQKSTEMLTARISELVGQPMACHHRHL